LCEKIHYLILFQFFTTVGIRWNWNTLNASFMLCSANPLQTINYSHFFPFKILLLCKFLCLAEQRFLEKALASWFECRLKVFVELQIACNHTNKLVSKKKRLIIILIFKPSRSSYTEISEYFKNVIYQFMQIFFLCRCRLCYWYIGIEIIWIIRNM
jgi:hypothetical protein